MLYAERRMLVRLRNEGAISDEVLAELAQEMGPIESRIIEEVRREWPAPGEKAQRQGA